MAINSFTKGKTTMGESLKAKTENSTIYFILAKIVAVAILSAGITYSIVNTFIITPKNEEIAKLKEALANNSKQVDALNKEVERIKISNPQFNPTPASTPQIPEEDSSPMATESNKQDSASVTKQEINGLTIEIINTRRIGDTLKLDLRLTNNTSEVKEITLFGKGLYGSSKIYSNGSFYEASTVTSANDNGQLHTVRVPNGTYINASVDFKNVPNNLHFTELIEVTYSYENSTPSGVIPFKNVGIK